jgi:hypothetical protein
VIYETVLTLILKQDNMSDFEYMRKYATPKKGYVIVEH